MPTPKGTIPWNAGTGQGWTDKRGYRWIYVTENGKRRAKREHRHIMEQHLGRRLAPEEVVHHRNGNPSDNRLENLEVQGWSEHTRDHSNGRRQTEYAKRTQSVIAECREENKRLRAINAEMLEALTLVMTHLPVAVEGDYEPHEGVPKALKAARAAIAKAEGKS